MSKGKWCLTKEQLPADTEEVLVVLNGTAGPAMMVCWFNEGGKRFYSTFDDKSFKLDDVLCWRLMDDIRAEMIWVLLPDFFCR